MSDSIAKALTIAGSDSGGGAGIQADLKTFTAHKVYGASVITAVTAQNTTGVSGIYDLPINFIEKQIDAVIKDIGFNSVKIGMLSNKSIINLVSEKMKQFDLKNIVLDPVMVATSGDKLLLDDSINALKTDLIPLADLITPNIYEAELLAGLKISSVENMKEAAEKLIKLDCKYVLIKGGHITDSDYSTDILYDGIKFTQYESKRINTQNTHGTGCTYSSAITANLAKGLDMEKAVENAKEYITQAISNSFNIGKGHGPLNHFWNIK